jgi:hypothetical protein
MAWWVTDCLADCVGGTIEEHPIAEEMPLCSSRQDEANGKLDGS